MLCERCPANAVSISKIRYYREKRYEPIEVIACIIVRRDMLFPIRLHRATELAIFLQPFPTATHLFLLPIIVRMSRQPILPAMQHKSHVAVPKKHHIPLLPALPDGTPRMIRQELVSRMGKVTSVNMKVVLAHQRG
jgi:hypothetical protein